MERIEHNKLELCAFTTGIGTKIGDFLDQARYEMYSFGSPTLFNLPEQIPISTLVADKIHDVFPHDREDTAFQMVAKGTGYIIDLNLILFAPALSEIYASKRAMDTSEFCMQTFDLIENRVCHSGLNFTRSSKSVNLPSLKKMHIKMEHILEGHIEGCSKAIQGANKTLFPQNLNKDQIRKMIEEAYKNGKKIKTQGERTVIHGYSQGTKIEMWVNTKTKTIETAYPKK